MSEQKETKAFMQIVFTSLALILALIPNAQAKDPLIEQMISTYQANQARFHQQFRGRTLEGEGRVLSIRTDPLGTGSSFYIDIDLNGSKINCDTKNQDIAASLNKGQSVKFSGRIHDVVFRALDVRECSFSDPEKALSQKPTINAKCTLTIKGKQEMNSSCYFSSDKDRDLFSDLKLELKCPNGKVTSGAGDGCAGFEIRTSKNGVFGMIDHDNGVGSLCWNEGKTRRAHQCFDNLQRKDGCWTNSEVSFCAYKN